MAKMKTQNTLIPAYGEDDIGDALIDMSVQCLDCKHLNNNMTTCKAFKNGIPSTIITGGHDHTKSFDNDNGIHFEEL